MEKTAAGDTQLDVDLAILDYLIHKATDHLLHIARTVSSNGNDPSHPIHCTGDLLYMVQGNVFFVG